MRHFRAIEHLLGGLADVDGGKEPTRGSRPVMELRARAINRQGMRVISRMRTKHKPEEKKQPKILVHMSHGLCRGRQNLTSSFSPSSLVRLLHMPRVIEAAALCFVRSDLWYLVQSSQLCAGVPHARDCNRCDHCLLTEPASVRFDFSTWGTGHPIVDGKTFQPMTVSATELSRRLMSSGMQQQPEVPLSAAMQPGSQTQRPDRRLSAEALLSQGRQRVLTGSPEVRTALRAWERMPLPTSPSPFLSLIHI